MEMLAWELRRPNAVILLNSSNRTAIAGEVCESRGKTVKTWILSVKGQERETVDLVSLLFQPEKPAWKCKSLYTVTDTSLALLATLTSIFLVKSLLDFANKDLLCFWFSFHSEIR